MLWFLLFVQGRGAAQNFPREFTPCPRCSKKGVYKMNPSSAHAPGNAEADERGMVITHPGGVRCKYCKWQVLWECGNCGRKRVRESCQDCGWIRDGVSDEGHFPPKKVTA